MQDHILSGCDFTEGAGWALERAVLIARRKNWRVRLLHVVDDDTHRPDSDITREEALAQAAAIGARHGVDIETRIVRGAAAEALVKEGQADGCRLVVLGPRSRRDARAWLLGSTAERVIRRCPTAILAVRRAPTGPYRRVLACLDFEKTSEDALREALSLDLVPEGGLAVAHAFVALVRRAAMVADIPVQEEERLTQEIGNEALTQAFAKVRSLGWGDRHVPTFIEEGEAGAVILDAAARWPADLLVMGSHGRGPVSEFFLGSTAATALRNAGCDVLVKGLG